MIDNNINFFLFKLNLNKALIFNFDNITIFISFIKIIKNIIL